MRDPIARFLRSADRQAERRWFNERLEDYQAAAEEVRRLAAEAQREKFTKAKEQPLRKRCQWLAKTREELASAITGATIMRGALQETLSQLDPERIFLISCGQAHDVTAQFSLKRAMSP